MLLPLASALLVVLCSWLVGRHSLRLPAKWLAPLACGALLAVLATHLIPEAWEGAGYYSLIGFAAIPLLLAAVDRFAHQKVAGSAQVVADFLHSLGDGATISTGYLAGFLGGFVTTLSVLAHELAKSPADVATFAATGKRARANQKNLIAHAGTILGAALPSLHAVAELSWITIVSAGVILYVLIFRLTPELIGDFRKRDRALQVALGLLGFTLIWLTAKLLPVS